MTQVSAQSASILPFLLGKSREYLWTELHVIPCEYDACVAVGGDDQRHEGLGLHGLGSLVNQDVAEVTRGQTQGVQVTGRRQRGHHHATTLEQEDGDVK